MNLRINSFTSFSRSLATTHASLIGTCGYLKRGRGLSRWYPRAPLLASSRHTSGHLQKSSRLPLVQSHRVEFVHLVMMEVGHCFPILLVIPLRPLPSKPSPCLSTRRALPYS
jgi:hypothetical protein